MKISEMKELVTAAKIAATAAETAHNETPPAPGDAQITALISIAKSLAVIAAVMVDNRERSEFREEVEEMRQERNSR